MHHQFSFSSQMIKITIIPSFFFRDGKGFTAEIGVEWRKIEF